MKTSNKETRDTLLARLVFLLSTLTADSRYGAVFPIWGLVRKTLEELAKNLGGPRTLEMLSGRVTPERRSARRRLLACKLVYPKITGKCQYAVRHKGLYESLKRGGFETVRDVASVNPSNFHRLRGFGDKRSSELALLLQDLLMKDIRLDTLVKSYHIGHEPNDVAQETAQPIKDRISALRRNIEAEENKLEELYGVGWFRHGKTEALRRYPAMSRRG